MNSEYVAANVADDIAVIVVTYNGEPWIRQCLGSLEASAQRPQVVVVDNASSDATACIVESQFPWVQLLRQPRNLGFGIGNNTGIRHAIGKAARYVFLLNQDAYVLPDTVGNLRRFVQAHTEFGVVSPLHCSPDAEHIDRRTLRGYLQNHLPAYLADACMGRVQPYYKTHGVNAAAWFIRVEVLQLAGGFDPLFFMYGEDDDLLARWAYHGVAFALITNTRVVHLRQSVTVSRPSFWQDLRRRAERRRAELLTLIKQPGFSVGHMAAVWLAYGLLAPWVDFLLTRRWRDFLASGMAAWRLVVEFPRILRHARLTAIKGGHFL